MKKQERARKNSPMWGKVKRIHMVGIGGAGMSGIAEVLLSFGYQVSGSDLKKSEVTERLKRLGGKIYYGHKAKQVGEAEVVVISSAVRENNPEVVEARKKKILVIHRAEMLAELMRLKQGIAVAGSHGKTTTSSMIATILHQVGLDPTAIIGGRLDNFKSGARIGKGALMVAEADESDGSFLKLRPVIAVVTNIDREHLDYYGSFEKLRESFLAFLNEVPFYGLDVIGVDCPTIRGLLGEIKRRFITYGESPDADLRAVEIRTGASGLSFEVIYQGKNLGRIMLGIPGSHNAINALASIAVGFELGLDFSEMAKALTGFKGVGRRFEIKGELAGITIVDDYGHHPREVQATLSAGKEWRGKNGKTRARRVVCAFQPHRYTRTKLLAEEFGPAFDQAEVLLMTEIYPAGEEPIAGISGRWLFEIIKAHRDKLGLESYFFEGFEEMVKTLIKMLRPGDLFLTIGAGNIWQVGEEIIKRLKK